MLMNIINMINCRVVTKENNVFKTIFDNSMFWIIFLIEMLVQNGIVLLAGVTTKPFDLVGTITGTTGIEWTMHLSAWIFGLFVLAIRPLTNMIPEEKFYFMDAIDLETKDGKANFVTRWSDRATEDYNRFTNPIEVMTPTAKKSGDIQQALDTGVADNSK